MVSIIAKFRAGHKIAQEQPSKKAEETSNAPSTPYRHIPSHAIIDALAGAPSYYRVQDQQRIMEQHKRRSQMSRPATSDGSYSTGSFARPSSRGRYSMDHSPPLPPSVDRGYGGGKGKLRADRHEYGIRRSPLSSMEISPHISAANSTKSTNSTSSQTSVESLSKIAEEGTNPRTEVEDMPKPNQYTIIPNSIIKREALRQKGSSQSRQLSISTPDVSQPIVTMAEAENNKPKRGWGFRRKSNATRG